MHLFILNRYFVLLNIFIFTPLFLWAQCPFTASITTTDAGGCGNINGGVYFTLNAIPPTSITGAYYLVYRTSDEQLVTANTNTNQEVSLPQGNYRAEVHVQCLGGGSQAPWTQNFTISSTTDNDFNMSYTTNVNYSRATTLNAFPSGAIAYEFTGTGPYTLDIIEYPAEYTGSLHFTGITNGFYSVEDLPAGDYKMRVTNGCKIITDGPRTITKTPRDMPRYWSARSLYLNSTEDGTNQEHKPTQNYYTVYFATGYAESGLYDYWSNVNMEKFYEYTWIHQGESIGDNGWHDMKHGSEGRITKSDELNKITCKYTIGDMFLDSNKLPVIHVRLKNTTQSINTSTKVRSTNFDETLVKPSPLDCDNVDLSVPISGSNNLTYPLDIIIRDYSNTNTLSTKTVTTAELFDPNRFVEVQNIDISNGYTVIYDCKGGTPYQLTATQVDVTNFGDLLPPLSSRRLTLTSALCEDYKLAFINVIPDAGSPVDLRGATFTYTGSIPLPSIRQSFTIPTDIGVLSSPTYLTVPASHTAPPWIAVESISYIEIDAGTYTWDIHIPCGAGSQVFSKSITIEAPYRAGEGLDLPNYDPQIISSTTCGTVDIELGNFNDLQYITMDKNGSLNYSSFGIYRRDSNSFGTVYRGLYESEGEVEYPGSATYYFNTSPQNSGILKPKIKIKRPGTYYLIVSPDVAPTIYARDGTCMILKEIIISENDFVADLDTDATAAYFCAQDHSTGNIFVQRKGSSLGHDFVFRVWNGGSYDKTVTSSEIQVAFTDINVATHGTTFSVSVEAVNACTSSPSTATISMNEVNNSTIYISQNSSSNCEGNIDLEIEAVAYSSTSYQWRDVTGDILSYTRILTGRYPTGTKLFLDVTFEPLGPGGTPISCTTWTAEYFIEGVPLAEYYWRRNAISSDWNNANNWNDKNGARASSTPGNCSSVFIPATVNTYFPDLSSVTSPITTNIHFEYGAQLYNQHKLTYKHAFVNYNTGYYGTLSDPAPSTLTQPSNAVNTVSPSSDNKAPVAMSSLPLIDRGRWYMLAAPLKGMHSGDFQLAAEPFSLQRYYKSQTTTNPNILAKDGFIVVPDNNTSLSENYNAIALWIVPHGESIGAKKQQVLEDLQGNITYPYFYPYLLNDELISLRPDVSFDRASDKMQIQQFEFPSLTPVSFNEIDRSPLSGRFIYEDDVTNSIPTGSVYTLDIKADSQRENGEVMIGNPFMAPIDFRLFLTQNMLLIENQYKIIVDGIEEVYPTSPTSLDNYIAPQQGFIIKLINPKAAASIKFSSGIMPNQTNDTKNIKVK